MLVYGLLALCLMLFMGSLKVTGLVPRVEAAGAAGRRALAVMRDPALSDDEKEVAMQKAALAMFGAFFLITLSVAVALAVPLGAVYLADLAGLVSLGEAEAAATDWVFIIVSSLFMIAAWRLTR